MNYREISRNVRIVFLKESPTIVTHDIYVERYIDNIGWCKEIGYNSMSDDYAMTNARQYAERIAKLYD